MSLKIGFSLLLALIWMLLTSQVNLEGLVVGVVLSLVILFFFPLAQGRVRWRKIPGQFVALMVYVAILYRDIFLSGLDIARRTLSADMRLKPGVVAVPVQDPEKSLLISALSADAISLTPGELVTEIQDNSILYVHTLDVDYTAANAADEQAERLRLLNRILGRGGS